MSLNSKRERERELRVSLSKVMIFGEPRAYSSAQSTFIKRVRKRLFVFFLVSTFRVSNILFTFLIKKGK